MQKQENVSLMNYIKCFNIIYTGKWTMPQKDEKQETEVNFHQ